MNALPDHVTRYNPRKPGLLDAPRVYNPYSKVDIFSWLAIAFGSSVMIVLSVMILRMM